jgi:hypothetical protein
VARSSADAVLAPRRRVAHHRVEDARLLEVGRHLHAGQGDEADPGIVDDATTEQLSAPVEFDRQRDRAGILEPLRQVLDLDPSDQARLEALDFIGDRLELLLDMDGGCRDRGDAEVGALPQSWCSSSATATLNF